MTLRLSHLSNQEVLTARQLLNPLILVIRWLVGAVRRPVLEEGIYLPPLLPQGPVPRAVDRPNPNRLPVDHLFASSFRLNTSIQPPVHKTTFSVLLVQLIPLLRPTILLEISSEHT